MLTFHLSLSLTAIQVVDVAIFYSRRFISSYYAITAVDELVLANTFLAIPPEESKACVQLLAVEDGIIESDELYTVTVDPLIVGDKVDMNISIVILDDDGECQIIVITHIANNNLSWCFFFFRRRAHTE